MACGNRNLDRSFVLYGHSSIAAKPALRDQALRRFDICCCRRDFGGLRVNGEHAAGTPRFLRGPGRSAARRMIKFLGGLMTRSALLATALGIRLRGVESGNEPPGRAYCR